MSEACWVRHLDLLKELCQFWPTPPGWSTPHVSRTAVGAGRWSAQIVVATSHGPAGIAIGRGVAGDESALRTAYYELLKDIAQLEKLAEPEETVRLLDLDLTCVTKRAKSAVLPMAVPGFAAAGSVAVGRNFYAVRDAAGLDLVLRDAVERAWTQRNALEERALSVSAQALGTKLADRFELRERRLPSSDPRAALAAVVGMPLDPLAEPIFGFGIGTSAGAASAAATGACVDRLAVQESGLETSRREELDAVAAWLGRTRPGPAAPCGRLRLERCEFLDLTPEGGRDHMFILKAFAEDARVSSETSPLWPRIRRPATLRVV